MDKKAELQLLLRTGTMVSDETHPVTEDQWYDIQAVLWGNLTAREEMLRGMLEDLTADVGVPYDAIDAGTGTIALDLIDQVRTYLKDNP